VVVSRGGRILFEGGRGLADRKTGRRITPDGVFRLGSITKQITAAAVLQLVADGKISLDDPVSKFLPNYPGPSGSATIRQLLNHTSGIPSYNDIPGWMVEANTSRPHTTVQLISVFQDLPSASPPGQSWAYSNSGYVLLGAVIEVVTGRPWHETVMRRGTAPLGLRTIGYGPGREAATAMVVGHTQDPAGAVHLARKTHMSVTHAAAGLVGSARDLASWTHALHHGRVVSPTLYAAMTTPTPLPDGRAAPYGFGLSFADVRGQRAIRHDGRIAGFNNEVIYVPADDVIVVVLTNSDRPATSPALLGRRLAALAVGKPFRVFTTSAVDVEALRPFLGVYDGAPSGVSRRFLERAGKFYLARAGAPEREVLAAGNNEFFFPDSFTWFRIGSSSGAAPTMRLHQDGAPEAEQLVRTGGLPDSAPA
jgi:CubicO group peptidase (beta-lactamase class C family)